MPLWPGADGHAAHADGQRYSSRPESAPSLDDTLDLRYHGGLPSAHMHELSASRPGEVDAMTGKWLSVLLSTPSLQIPLSGRTDAQVDAQVDFGITAVPSAST